MMAAVFNSGPAQKLPLSPDLKPTERPDSMASFKTIDTETETVAPTERGQNDNEDLDDSLVLAIRALRLLENPQAAATEAIQAFDPKASLSPDLVRLLVAAAVRHPDIAQGLIELGSSQNGHLIRRTPSGSLQTNGSVAGRHASSLVHEISISSLLTSISESSSRRAAEASTNNDASKPTLKRRLSVLSNKKPAESQQAPPRRKEKVSTDIVQKICKANLKDTKESIDKLERADKMDEFLGNSELKKMAEECLGHETGKFALCLALTLRDETQRWDAVRNLMNTMVDKLSLLLTMKGVFGPDGAVGLPGQDGFGIRDCWVVLSEAEREHLATEDDGAWPKRLRESALMSPQHAEKAWEIVAACEKIQDALTPSEDANSEVVVAKRPKMAAASPQEITDRWAFFFDLLDEEAARRCFRELRLLRQLFNAAQTPSEVGRAAALKSKAKKAFEMSRPDDDVERWLDTKWAISAMKGFMVAKAQGLSENGEVSYESLDRLDNAFCKTFWGCLGAGDHKRLAAEEGKQWVSDIMNVFGDRRRHDVMFRLRDILHFMQNNM